MKHPTHLHRIGKVFLYVYDNIEGLLLYLFIALLVIDVLLGIAARFIHFDVVFATELGKYLFIWLCAIGISAAAKDNQHVRINFMVEQLPISRRLTWILSQVMFLIFALFFCYWGLQLTWMHYSMGKSTMGFTFPLFVFTAALPVGFGLTAIRLTVDIARCIMFPGRYQPWISQTPIGIDDRIIRERRFDEKDPTQS